MNTANLRQFIRRDLQAYIYADALLENLKQLKGLCRPGVKFCAVVKANAYGHGIEKIVSILKNADVDFFAVASFFEALHISPLLSKQSILILEPIYEGKDRKEIVLCARQRFHCAISSIPAVEYLSSTLSGSDLRLDLHVNIETGMGRCGIQPGEGLELIKRINQSKNLWLSGVYTHFATADEDDLSFAYEQLAIFNDFLANASSALGKDVLIHAANSAATIKMPQAHFDMVRCGISMYGYFSRPQEKQSIKLVPVMKLQAPITSLKKIQKGQSVSYGRSFIAKRDTLVALVPLGYSDGYWRCFSNRASMKLGQKAAPVIGRVCMDHLLLDVTDIPEVRVGQMVTIIDNDPHSVCGVYTLADMAETICYEILTCVHAHVNRILR